MADSIEVKAAAEALWIKDCDGRTYGECYAQAFAAHRLATEQASDKLVAEFLLEHGYDWLEEAILRGKHRRK
jgi:hypothetical protein